jgi:hypothetical protein
MSESLRSADRNTYLRIVAVALVALAVVVTIGTFAREIGPGTVMAGVKADRPVLKAGQPASYTDNVTSAVR